MLGVGACNPKRCMNSSIMLAKIVQLCWENSSSMLKRKYLCFRIRDIGKFERNNLDISIGIIAVGEDLELFPVRVPKEKRQRHVDLLLLTTEDSSHYVTILNKSALLRSQLSKREHHHFFCDYCLCHFTAQKVLDEHTNLCMQYKPHRAVYPKPGSTVKFTKSRNQVFNQVKIICFTVGSVKIVCFHIRFAKPQAMYNNILKFENSIM